MLQSQRFINEQISWEKNDLSKHCNQNIVRQ